MWYCQNSWQNLAKSYSRAGVCDVKINKIPEALVYLKKAEDILNTLVEKEPKNKTYQKDFGRFYIRLGDLKSKQRDFAEALESYERSVSFFERIERSDEKNTLAKRDLAQSLKNVGDAQLKLNKPADAKESYRKTFEILNFLKSQNALPEFDQKMYAEVQTALQKL